MAFNPLTGGGHREPAVASGDWTTDHWTRIAFQKSQRLERKRQELREQVSARNTPAERIRIWERRHGLTLPRDSNHKLLAVVAAATDLALQEVHEEQRRRSSGLNTDSVDASIAVNE